MILSEIIIHALTGLIVLIPFYLLLGIKKKTNGQFIKSLTWLFVGILPLAIYHFLEIGLIFDIHVMPIEGTFAHSIISHGVVVIAFIAMAWFILNFKKHYITPIYG